MEADPDMVGTSQQHVFPNWSIDNPLALREALQHRSHHQILIVRQFAPPPPPPKIYCNLQKKCCAGQVRFVLA